MKIAKVTDEAIIFDNGNKITYDWNEDRCCDVRNYADFSILDRRTINYDYDFDTNLKFKFVKEAGFKFGSDGHWIFIPCYSYQNGFYTTYIEIYYNGKQVLSGSCPMK